MKQSELIKQMSSEELKKQVIFSQLLFLCIGVILSFFLFDNMSEWLKYFYWDQQQLLIYGVIPGLLIVFIDLLIMKYVPKRFYDDGGINEKIFQNRTITDIFVIALVVAVSEEILFRGVIQSVFGYVFASTLFALIHFRYLKKPVLLISILFISFYIGYLFKITGNLFVTIITHFIVDFLLGLFIRFKK